MGLYLGNNQIKIHLNGDKCSLNLFSETPITNGVVLLSSDNYILKDINGLYVTAKEDE